MYWLREHRRRGDGGPGRDGLTTTPVADPRSRRGGIGSSAPRVDAGAKIRGEAEFAGDLDLPELAFGAVLRSTVPHARIRSIDTGAAERLPGVVCVLTAADLADLDPYWGHRIRDRPILAVDRVRDAGGPVAAGGAHAEAGGSPAERTRSTGRIGRSRIRCPQ